MNKEIGYKYYPILEPPQILEVMKFVQKTSKFKKCRSLLYPQDEESMRIFIVDLLFYSLLEVKKIGDKCCLVF